MWGGLHGRGGFGVSEELKMYVEYRDGKPHSYLYGPSWKAMELYMEGGYPTPEEAKAAWEAEEERRWTSITRRP